MSIVLYEAGPRLYGLPPAERRCTGVLAATRRQTTFLLWPMALVCQILMVIFCMQPGKAYSALRMKAAQQGFEALCKLVEDTQYVFVICSVYLL